MQIVQKLYVELQEMLPDMKIKTGHFWFQNKEYFIVNGEIKEQKGEIINKRILKIAENAINDLDEQGLSNTAKRYTQELKGENND